MSANKDIIEFRDLEQDEAMFISDLYSFHPFTFMAFRYKGNDYFAVKSKIGSVFICEKFKSKKLVEIEVHWPIINLNEIAVGKCLSGNPDHKELMDLITSVINSRMFESFGEFSTGSFTNPL